MVTLHLLDWHRREVKSEWWEFYRLGELSDEELLDERSALSGLSFVERLGVQRNIPTDRYAFEKQETDIRAEEELCAKKEKIGEVIAIDLAARSIDIKKTKKTAELHPAAVYAKGVGPARTSLPTRSTASVHRLQQTEWMRPDLTERPATSYFGGLLA